MSLNPGTVVRYFLFDDVGKHINSRRKILPSSPPSRGLNKRIKRTFRLRERCWKD